MLFYFLIFIALCLYKVRIKHDESGFMSDYMSVEKTTAIKGIFIVIVFFSHFKDYVSFVSPLDITFYESFSKIGQRMVTMFLFYSGFGVMESIKRKGIKYVKAMPKHRLLHVLVEFDIAVVIFTVIKILLKTPFNNGKIFDLKQFLLALLAWESVGNSNWYIFCILAAYVLTFISFLIFKCKKIPSLICNTVLTVALIVCFEVFEIRESFWYNTLICYVGGMWYSFLRKYIEKAVPKNAVWIPVFVVSFALCLYSVKLAGNNLFLYEISILLFVWVVLLLAMKVSICNKPLVWLGKNLFPLYIFQRLPMIIFDYFGLSDYNIYLYFAVCFAVTVGIAWLFSKFSKWLWAPKTKQVKAER